MGYSPWGHKESDATEATLQLIYVCVCVFVCVCVYIYIYESSKIKVKMLLGTHFLGLGL